MQKEIIFLMSSWEFFKTLCFVYGLFLLGESSFVFLLPKVWLRMIVTVYPEKKPKWLVLVFLFFFLFSAYVAYRFFIGISIWAFFPFLLTIVILVTLGEMFFQYRQFRDMILNMILIERGLLAIIVFIEGVTALLFLALACFGF